ncbi:MAG: SRPBCC family protein [Chloroflexi bacterium]|nr:SRPBCC family protein [Chloroflexota bacterium]
MSPIPIRLPAMEVHVDADRRLAFQVITAFGASSPGDGPSSRVLSQETGRILVEFHVPATGLFGRRKVYRTVEWVTPHEPERVEFETVKGPLSMMRDRFILEAEGGCTHLRYESEFGVWGWVAGWLVGMLYVRPKLKRLMQGHLEEMKQAIEARAARSRAFPQQPCSPEGATSHADPGS